MILLNKLQVFKSDETLRNGVFFSIYAFVGRGISFLLLIVLANYILPADYGKLSLFNTVVMLLGYFMAFSTSGYFGVSFFKENEETFHQDFTSIVLLLLITVLITSVVFILFSSELTLLAGINTSLLWVALAIAALNILFQLHMDYYRLKEQVGLYGIMNIGNALLNAIISLGLVIGFAQGWMGRVNTQLVVTLLFGIIAIVFFKNKSFFDFNLRRGRLKLLLCWGLPQIPHMATTWIRQGCDQYIINYNYTTYEVGLFSFSLNLVSIITMIGMAFNSSNSVTIFKILSDKCENNKLTLLKNNTRRLFLVYLITTILIIIASVIFVPLILPQYVEGVPYFVVLSVYGFFVCLYFLYCNYLFYYEHTKELMLITFGTSMLHFVLSFFLTKYSLFFTASIYIFTQFICVGLVYFCSRRYLNKYLVCNA